MESSIGFAKITRDLTERRAAEQQLKLSEEQFRLLVQGVTDYAIYMLDPEGRVTNWNLGAQRIKGYLPSEIIGKHFSQFYPDADREAGEPDRAIATARARGKIREGGLARPQGRDSLLGARRDRSPSATKRAHSWDSPRSREISRSAKRRRRSWSEHAKLSFNRRRWRRSDS